MSRACVLGIQEPCGALADEIRVLIESAHKRADLYYIQNRGYCGNCLRWWKDGGHGYTSNLDEAWKVGREQVEGICQSRPDEDIAWPVAKADAAAVRHVDSERLREVEA